MISSRNRRRAEAFAVDEAWFRGRRGPGSRKCYNFDYTPQLANGCPYSPKCQICGALHKLSDCPVLKDLIEKRKRGQAGAGGTTPGKQCSTANSATECSYSHNGPMPAATAAATAGCALAE